MCKNSSSKLLNHSVDTFFVQHSNRKDSLNIDSLNSKSFLEFKGELGYGSWGIPLLVKS